MVTATLGSKGALVFDGTRFYRQLPHLVRPVDTMGAGDSFAAAMLVHLLQAMDSHETFPWESSLFCAGTLPAALEAAAEFSSKTCLVHGAFDCGVPVPPSLKHRIYQSI